MKKILLWLTMLAAAGALHAQNINGAWQGTLKIGPQELRIVMKIAVDDKDHLKADMYSIDQNSGAIPASAITRDGSTIKITIARIGGNYEGKLGPDGTTMTGTWSQGGPPAALILVRATPATEWPIPEPTPPPAMMKADAKPSFEVSTIKPSKPEERFSLTINRSGMLNTTDTSLSDLIKFAYDMHPRQVIGGPAWVETEKYAITGKPDTPGMPSTNQLKLMLQGLISERFHLTFHREKKELPVYAITVAKTGSKLNKNDSNPNGLPGFAGGGPGGLRVSNATIAELANIFQARLLDRPVVDQTGLGAARWDFILRWTPDAAQAPPGAGAGAAAPPPAPDADAPPDLFLAMQQQLGLKLEATKAPVDVMVIDKVEKPTAN